MLQNSAVRTANKAAKAAKKKLQKKQQEEDMQPQSVATTEITQGISVPPEAEETPAYRLEIKVPETPIKGTARVFRALERILEAWRKDPALETLECTADAYAHTREGKRAARELNELGHAAAWLLQQIEKRTKKSAEENEE